MSGSGRRPALLVDTSVAVALLLTDHEAHTETKRAAGRGRIGLAGHAAFETFSVLSRLPPPARRTPDAIQRMFRQNFTDSRFLNETAAKALLDRLGPLAIAGGAIYDALVGAVAVAHDAPLLTRDRRAVPVYQALGVDFTVVPPGE